MPPPVRSVVSFAPVTRVAVAALTVLAATAMTAGNAAAQSSQRPVPPSKSTGIAPKGDFTKDLQRPKPEAELGQAPGGEGSDEAFRAKAEADAIRKANAAGRHDLIKRTGSRLVLPTVSGRPELFDSVWPNATGHGEAAYEDYRFDGLTPDREFFVVRATYYDRTDVIWVSRQDGERTSLHANPRPSPDGTQLAVVSASELLDFNGIVIWERASGRLVERFRHVPPADQLALYRFMRWKDNRTIELERTAAGDPVTCPNGAEDTLVVLKRDGESWALKDVTVPRCKR
ncbi:hypothetical protein PV762_04530 [Mitsuaria sp. CC2]|jgi:hypothetical protein|uniref:hypothetical protein n=1 Tax=Mitsuaria sp. CC2 TaxID=3029186 RepID=UPI003B8DC153